MTKETRTLFWGGGLAIFTGSVMVWGGYRGKGLQKQLGSRALEAVLIYMSRFDEGSVGVLLIIIYHGADV